MRITPHSTLAISTCALALLSKYLVFTQIRYGTPERAWTINIRWCGGDGDQLSLARVTWNENNAFMKCDTVTKEVKAFKALKEAKRLTDLNTLGRQNVMDPLLQFDFYEENVLIYLYNAGIIHKDIVPKNIMLQLGSDDKIVGVKIIDLDLTNVFAKEQGWQPIHQRNREDFTDSNSEI
ncbi:hypothetical protein BDF22DRAFT_778755 [Syncephalis plumigaleata]|nr:hypothetical protein BDF22DRAFT_778755 [Syncephalis plumigaleata]